MANNKNMTKAKRAKDDEFYTPYDFVAAEVERYEEQLKGKSVYCPCDDPRWSNFPRYFINKYDDLELKYIICSFVNDMDEHKNWVIKYESQGNNGMQLVYDDECKRMEEAIAVNVDLHELHTYKVITERKSGYLF